MRSLIRTAMVTATLGFATAFTGCSTSGSHSLTCNSTEVAPNSQPGADTPQRALEWFLKNGNSSLPRSGFKLSGSSGGRYVFSDGANQISVSALPADKGQPRIWVVLMTYECS